MIIILVTPIEKATKTSDIVYQVQALDNQQEFERGYNQKFEGLDDTLEYTVGLKKMFDERLLTYFVQMEFF